MRSDVEKVYSQSIKRADAFLQTKKSIAKGTSITNSRELCLLRNDAECPICGIRFSGKNNNTEHIHPRALGGLNDDYNKVQMCTACNHDRNLTMQAMLGTPPYYKNYEKIKPDVIEFILWAEITVDRGLEEGKIFPRPHQLFIEARFANDVPPMPRQAYGRFSSWSVGDPPNLRFNGSGDENRQTKEIQSGRKIGLVERFFDKLFGYQPHTKESNQVTAKKKLETDSEIQNHTKLTSKDSPSHRGSDEGLDKTQFVTIITKLIADENEKSLAKVAQEFVAEMRILGYDVDNVTQCLKIFNLPRGLKKAIINLMPDLVVIGGSPTAPNVSLVRSSQHTIPQQKYPLIAHLNSSRRGLKLPRNPWDLVKSLNWFILNAKKYDKLADCDDAFKEEGILPKSKTRNAIVRFVQGLTEDGDYNSITEETLGKDLGSILDNIQSDILERGIKMDYVENKDDFKIELRKYFQSAKDSLN